MNAVSLTIGNPPAGLSNGNHTCRLICNRAAIHCRVIGVCCRAYRAGILVSHSPNTNGVLSSRPTLPFSGCVGSPSRGLHLPRHTRCLSFAEECLLLHMSVAELLTSQGVARRERQKFVLSVLTLEEETARRSNRRKKRQLAGRRGASQAHLR